MLFKKLINLAFAIFILIAPVYNVLAHSDGGIVVKDAWVREAPPNAKVLGAYMTIENHTNKEKTLTGVSSPAFSKVEIHKTVHKGDMASMEKQKQLSVPAEGEVKLKPGNLHLMLFNPKNAVKAGDKINFTLKFSNGSTSMVSADVKKATGGNDHHHHSEQGEHSDHTEHQKHETQDKTSGQDDSHHHNH